MAASPTTPSKMVSRTTPSARSITDRDGTLWIGTQSGGLNVIENGRIAAAAFEGPRPRAEIAAIYRDRERRAVGWYASTASSGSRTGRRTRSGRAHGLSSSKVRFITEDPGGDLWIGTSNGIAKRTARDVHELRTGRRLGHWRDPDVPARSRRELLGRFAQWGVLAVPPQPLHELHDQRWPARQLHDRRLPGWERQPLGGIE